MTMPFYGEDLTVNDGNLNPDGSDKRFDIKVGCDWAKIRSIKVLQLIAGVMNITFEIWEKDASGYNPVDRSTFYLRILRRNIRQGMQEGAEYLEIINPELLFHDRDRTGELHCRLVNNSGGTASDFAVVAKMGEVGESL